MRCLTESGIWETIGKGHGERESSMDMLFVLIAACPAVIMAGYEMKGKGASWRGAVFPFARWLYGITFADLLVLYLRGWGSFDFTVLTVQFRIKYMVMSSIAAFLGFVGKKVLGLFGRARRRKGAES